MSSTTRARLAVGLVAAVILGVIAFLSLHERSAGPSDEPVTNFYAAPANPPADPGKLIRSEPVTTRVPDGVQAWRILYTTTREKGVPAVASALVIAKQGLDGGKHPVIAWAHGTTGVAGDCAPSIRMDDTTFGAIPGLDQAISKGWVVVATDYVGLGTVGPHPFLIGQGEGRSVLDSVRAAHELSGVSLAHHTIVWGHSQGGHAALWAGILAPTYAPDAYVEGVGAIAPASNLGALMDDLGRTPGGAAFGAYTISAYEAAYPDVAIEKYLKPAAREPMTALAGLCVTQALNGAIQDPAFQQDYYAKEPSSGRFGKLLTENSPTGKITVPVFIGQGANDVLVLPGRQAAYVAARCGDTSNGPLDYISYPGLGHINVITAGSSLPGDLVDWTAARLAGKKAPTSCN